MRPQRTRPTRTGFSLVEILIAVMILGIGLVMIAGAFPVGLQYYGESNDKTIAALLAHSAVAAVKMYRTPDAETAFTASTDWTYFADAKGQLAVCECFNASAGVKYLFDPSVPGHSGGLLESMLGGADINDWLPQSERVYRPDPQYACQLFYQRMSEPDHGGAPGSATRMFQVFVLVQKSPAGRTGTYDQRFPPPSAPLAVGGVNATAQTFTLDASAAVAEGAAVIDLSTGDVYSVIEVTVAGGVKTVRVARSPAGLSGHSIRVVPNVVGVFTSVVSKTLPE
jgi:prepilin-type N-terminal cleavage/methylation domain-containing protein